MTSSDYLGGAVTACAIYVAAISGLKNEAFVADRAGQGVL